MAIQDVPETDSEALQYAAAEAGAAHKDTAKILALLTPGPKTEDPIAAIIEHLEIINTKLDRVLARLPRT
jgi:hypothetical protein